MIISALCIYCICFVTDCACTHFHTYSQSKKENGTYFKNWSKILQGHSVFAWFFFRNISVIISVLQLCHYQLQWNQSWFKAMLLTAHGELATTVEGIT